MNKKENLKISLNIFAIDFILFLYVITSAEFVKKSEFIQNIIDRTDILIILILLACILHSKMKFTLEQIIGFVTAIIIVFITYIRTGYSEFLKGILLILVVRSSNYKELFKSMRTTITIAILITMGLYILGVSNAGILRRGALSLGFSNATALGLFIMIITFLSLAIDPKMRMSHRLILLGTNIAAFLLSGSRTSFILSVSGILLSIFDINKIFKHKIIKTIIYILPLLFLLLSYILSELYPSSRFVQTLDPITNYRLSLNYRNIHLVGITIFGKNIDYLQKIKIFYNSVTDHYSNFNTIDSSYILSLLEMGIASTIVWLSVYLLTVKKLFMHNKNILVLISALLSIYGLFESSILNFTIMFPFLTLLCTFSDD